MLIKWKQIKIKNKEKYGFLKNHITDDSKLLTTATSITKTLRINSEPTVLIFLIITIIYSTVANNPTHPNSQLNFYSL